MSSLVYLSDRIKELSYTIGTANFSLASPVQGFSSFSSFYKDQDLLFYAATDGSFYEVGSGIFSSGISGFSIERYPFKSNNNNNKISFNEGIKEIYATYPATHAVYTGSGISGFNVPQSSGLAYWKSSNMLQYDSYLVWNDQDGFLGINTNNPNYGIDLGGFADAAIVRCSGIIVGSSGIYFPPQNDGDSSYLGGRQVTHYEKNRLDQYAYDNSLLGELTGSNAVLALSGVANQYILFKKQNAGFVFAGPPSGCNPPCSPGYPSFRTLTIEDVPELQNVSGILNNKIFTALSNITTASGALNAKINSVSGILSSDIYTVSGILNNLSTQTGVDVCQGRLTLLSYTPVTTQDQVNKSIVYYTPLSTDSNKITLYDGSAWQVVSFTEKALSLFSLTNNTNYDVFGYLNGGNLEIQLGQSWSNDNQRSENVALKDGILCKALDYSKRYLGTIRTTSSSTTEDSETKRFVWNAHNRISKTLKNNLGNFTWTYSTAQWRATRNIKSAINLVYGGIDSPGYKENIDLRAGLIYSGDGTVTITTTTTPAPTTTTTTLAPGVTTSTTSTTTTSGPLINSLYSWGRDADQELVNGAATSNVLNPGYVDTIILNGSSVFNSQFDKIACGQYFSAAITLEGYLVAGGYNGFFQIGTGSSATPYSRAVTTSVGLSQFFSDVACGQNHLLALNQDSTLWVAGNNTSGQLGITGTSANIRQQSSSEAWAKIAAGGNRSFGIKTNSTLWGWGDGSSLSIKPDISESSSSPINLQSFILAGLGQASQVFCGSFHNVLITSLGNVLTWGGNNLYGELGIATNSNSSRLYYNNLKDGFGYDQSFTSQTFIQAACGVSHTLLLSDSGNLYSCGRNQFGQLGDGTFTDRNRFNLIGTGFAKISAGAWFSAAIKNNGDLYVWGHNSFGQVGNGTTVALNAPTQIILSNVQKVSCGYTHTLAIR